jgi:response regulator RpfG family c-di-GMP phosphodiesterase
MQYASNQKNATILWNYGVISSFERAELENNKKNSVLIVDDVASNIATLRHILSAEYTVYASINGRNALIAADSYLPDVVLLDVLMPEMDGFAVIKALKASDRTKDIPVIFITSLDNSRDEEKGLSLGAVDYISKPFSPAIVRLRVGNQIKIINQTRRIIETELAEKSSRAKSEFLSRMSHEMRTPMNAIMGMTVMAMKTGEHARRDDMLQKISDASGQLLKLIDDVLDVSAIQDSKLVLACTEYSFADILQGILDDINPIINAKGQTLTADIDHRIDIIQYPLEYVCETILSTGKYKFAILNG